jgi:hypothetical protein
VIKCLPVLQTSAKNGGSPYQDQLNGETAITAYPRSAVKEGEKKKKKAIWQK